MNYLQHDVMAATALHVENQLLFNIVLYYISILFTAMRIKYKDKNETFTEDNLICKEPIGQFKVWFDEACNTPQILEPNAMLLATATR